MEGSVFEDISVRFEEGEWNDPKVTTLYGIEAIEKIDNQLKNRDKNIIDFEIRINDKILPKSSRVGGNNINEYLENIKKDKIYGEIWGEEINKLKEHIQGTDLSKENKEISFSKKDIIEINKILDDSLEISRSYLKENPSSYFNIKDREIKITDIEKYKENIGRVTANIQKLPEETKGKFKELIMSNDIKQKEKVFSEFFDNYIELQKKENNKMTANNTWKNLRKSRDIER